MALETILMYMINHVFLPPKLPQQDDEDVEMDIALQKEFWAALISFKDRNSQIETSGLVPSVAMAHTSLLIRDGFGALNPEKLETVFKNMVAKDVLAIHIRAQNAGLIIRKHSGQFSFESFELSPTAGSVMESTGRLIRCFPGPCIGVELGKMADPAFRDAFIQHLVQLDVHTPKESVPTVRKAGSKTTEVRDTIHPKLVTEMLTGILRGMGKPFEAVRIHKRTRDDVLWENTLKPWRRSPLWLLLRVALQTTLMDNQLDHTRYKSFMIFFMARLLEKAVEVNLPSDILSIMVAKIGRRALKLDLGGEDIPWVKYVHKIIEDANCKLGERWNQLEQNPDPLGLQNKWEKWRKTEKLFDNDTKLSLHSLQPYLQGISSRSQLSRDNNRFVPDHISRVEQNCSVLPIHSPSSSSKSYDARLWLLDVEQWVQECLEGWLATEGNQTSQQSCDLLSELINDYRVVAESAYAGNAEDISLMLLTLLQLWVAIDMCATSQITLLKNYEPGFPKALFDPLLLPQKIQMERLFQVESYIESRRVAARHLSSLIFEDTNMVDSFAVEYYNRSWKHQELRRRIEDVATAERSRKRCELEEMTRKYNRLIQESNSKTHENVRGFGRKSGRPYSHHDRNRCSKCTLQREADNLKIYVHEWPLPDNDLDAKLAVFELDVPKAMLRWRDITYTLLVDVFSPRLSEERLDYSNTYMLKEYDGLANYACQMGRLQLASHTKSFMNAHYRSKAVSQATEGNICVNNGLKYNMYDSRSRNWTPEPLGRCTVKKICTLQLPTGIYKSMQWMLDGTTHTTNEILAKQSKCPRELDQHQFYVFGALRSGSRLQWRNIARELSTRILNFNHEEIYLLIVQAAWQAGGSDVEFYRESHVDLGEEDFGITLASALEEALGTVEGSWRNSVVVRTLIIIAIRLLSVSPHATVHGKCFDFLRRTRGVTLAWAREVVSLVHGSQDGEQVASLNSRALELFLLCNGTYHVDQNYLSRLLESSEDVADFIECCIGIRDRCPAETINMREHLKGMLRRHEKLTKMIECELFSLILRDQDGIDKAIGRVWEDYRPGGTWSALTEPAERWITTKTDGESSNSGNSSLPVHYNILDGTLLVNGLPLTRLPRHYELHSTYKRLFGDKVLDVVLSTMTGMEFATRKEIYARQIHFRMCGLELIIKSKAKDQIDEVIPITAMSNDFPHAFVYEYVHWRNSATGEIEWRHLKDPWTSCPQNWRMKKNKSQEFVLACGSRKMIDTRSSTARAISQVLSPLESATHIQTILNLNTGELETNLPRMKLDFTLKTSTSTLESKQFRGMILDEQQSFGTFTGLVNKIVLRQNGSHSRSVLVPYCDVSFKHESNHIGVLINTGSNNEVKYHIYQIDDLLGRLIDNGNLQSRLFKLYLHATTSHCMPDKLTGRTGTEEALSGLASGATRSFVKLEPLDVKLLKKIGALTPQREFYPSHLRVMQEVHWHSYLSPLSQHCEFYTQATGILAQAKEFEILQEDPEQLEKIPDCGDLPLFQRAAIRESAFRVAGFGAEKFTTMNDSIYNSRDRSIDTARELRTYEVSKLVDDWSTNLTVCTNLLSEIESWPDEISGPRANEELKWDFDVQLLEAQPQWFSDNWCILQKRISQAVSSRDKYKILFLLSTLAYSDQANQKLMKSLLAFATLPELRILEPPDFQGFQLDQGYQPKKQTLITLIEEHTRKFYQCPESNLIKLEGETEYEADERREDLYKASKKWNVEKFVEQLTNQWPTSNINTPTHNTLSQYISVNEAMQAVRPSFDCWHQNFLFQQYIQQVQKVLNHIPPQRIHLEKYLIHSTNGTYTVKKSFVNFPELMETPAPIISPIRQLDLGEFITPGVESSIDHSKLDDLLSRISSESSNTHEQCYAKDLRASFDALPAIGSNKLKPAYNLSEILKENLHNSRERVSKIYQAICAELEKTQNPLHRKACLLPRICPTSILSHLARSISKTSFINDNWKQCLVDYGLAITHLQRAERLIASIENQSELLSEIENTGHQNWDPMCHPEWLLLEIENNILIRLEQAQIGQEMISPSSGSNSAMQLNMGLGKSSVIVPIVAADLADSTKLVRVVVLKPLAMQMFQLLAKKLGGMMNRRVLYMPISRSLRLDVYQARQILEMYQECMESGSILLLQPEHILSFELMGIDRLLSGDTDTGNFMIEAQNWLYKRSRDILDESDEILSVRFELIYTLGEQQSIELAPERWGIIQHVFGLVGSVAKKILQRFPNGLEILPNKDGSFPKVRIIDSSVGKELLQEVIRRLLQDGLPGLPLWTMRKEIKASISSYLADSNSALENSEHWSDTTKSILLLLKGLFGYGILKFALEQKRWRVNYGLDLSRSMLAVPFHAKDIPAARAEFSHPDATIVLTCLTYYYSGLSNEQIYLSFEKLLQSDSPNEEFDRWVKDAPGLAPEFRHITGINLSNTKQCLEEVFPQLELAKAVIDFYLTFIVFPREMKEFPDKLSSSGWDIAREKDEKNPTTGFSGTNDSRYVLPLSISQRDLPEQLSTNAIVLDTLLRPENDYMDVSTYSPTGVLNASILLKMVVSLEPKIRVILDVGAQVIEKQNEDVARDWLEEVPVLDAQVVIFFDHRNEICVLSRDGRKEPLQISPFSKQIDQCLVYLDESHTRGTDLKLPTDYRALVTLGPGLPKDRLVQACMRMRKLGRGQSVLLCSSMEIQRKILECNRKTSGPIEVADVLRWSISETCSHTRRSIPLWATQGLRHQHRRAAYSSRTMTTELAGTLREPEAQTLEQRYGVRNEGKDDPILKSMKSNIITGREKQIDQIRAKCEEFEIQSFKSATLHEEQERELSPENEREQQVELPPSAEPCIHSLHQDVTQMITDGVINRWSSAFQPAFDIFCQTTASMYFEPTAWPKDLLVTTDFARTVKTQRKGLDSFLRPVHWIISCHGQNSVGYVVLSPYEVQLLLPSIRQSKQITLHIYAPRINKSVQALEALTFCAIPSAPETRPPPPLVKQLNLFAGQLYIQNYEEYKDLCGFLGISHGEEDIKTDSDGFVKPENRANSKFPLMRECQFQTSPVSFLTRVFAMRRKGHSITSSHIGKIMKGELVNVEQF